MAVCPVLAPLSMLLNAPAGQARLAAVGLSERFTASIQLIELGGHDPHHHRRQLAIRASKGIELGSRGRARTGSFGSRCAGCYTTLRRALQPLKRSITIWKTRYVSPRDTLGVFTYVPPRDTYGALPGDPPYVPPRDTGCVP